MSKSNLYGSRDRRVPVPGSDWISTKTAFDEVWDAADYEPESRSSDSASRWYFEQQCYERALRRMPEKERMEVEAMAVTLDKKLGRGAGRGTAIQVLARLGVYFNLNNYGGK